MSDIFISYARADRHRVKPLVAALQAQDWSVWWDPVILPGKTFDQVIEAALDEARCVIVLWSRDSVDSEWVRTEAEEGRRRGILVPALLDAVKIPLAFRRIQAANLVTWSGGLPDELALAVSDVLSRAAPRPVVAAADPPGQTRVNPKDGLSYVWIPPGKFMMGCSPGDGECFDDEKPAHEVSITRGFWMGQTPVTEAAYARFARAAGKSVRESGNPDLPAVNVSWDDAKAYCDWAGMRLPTEAEWEYAARAGTTGPRYGELEAVAWYGDNSGKKLLDTAKLWKDDRDNYSKVLRENGNRVHPVGGKHPNAWGLHDTLGNVWEWVADWHGNYEAKAATDPSGPKEGRYRVLRGGSWADYPRYVRVSDRLRVVPADRGGGIGFRCAGELR